jgi:hypothetical protein
MNNSLTLLDIGAIIRRGRNRSDNLGNYMKQPADPPLVLHVKLKPGTSMPDSVIAATDTMINTYFAVFECPGGKKYTRQGDGTYVVIVYMAGSMARVRAILERDFVIVREE